MGVPYQRMPIDAAGNAIPDMSPARLANARYSSTNQSASSVITFNDNTSILEITTGTAAIALRFIASTDTQASVIGNGASANFDHVVAGNWTQRFAIPIETIGTASIVGINKQAGLYNRVAWINAGSPASIFAAEF